MIEDFSLVNRQAVVIGGARGIGRGIVLALAEAGAAVAVVSRTQATVDSTVDRVKTLGMGSFGYVADATNSRSMDECAEAVLNDLPDLDIIVNCVGDSMRQSLVTLPDSGKGMSSADWHNIVDINLTSAFEGCRVFGNQLIQTRGGSVINVSGVRAFRALPNGTAYSAGKAGMAMLTQSLALEWAPFGVRVNAIAPGLFPDPEQETPQQFEEHAKSVQHRIPLGRVGNMREAGLMAVYLASPAASYVTGQTFVIDGGTGIA